MNAIAAYVVLAAMLSGPIALPVSLGMIACTEGDRGGGLFVYGLGVCLIEALAGFVLMLVDLRLAHP